VLGEVLLRGDLDRPSLEVLSLDHPVRPVNVPVTVFGRVEHAAIMSREHLPAVGPVRRRLDRVPEWTLTFVPDEDAIVLASVPVSLPPVAAGGFAVSLFVTPKARAIVSRRSGLVDALEVP